jgi:hypothetical protein
MSSSRKASKETREANVLLEFEMVEAMSAEVLDANSDDVMDAVLEHAPDIALGPAIALNVQSCSIKLRFDFLAKNDAEIHKKIGKVIAIILQETDLELEVSRSSVEAHDDAEETPTGEFAAA